MKYTMDETDVPSQPSTTPVTAPPKVADRLREIARRALPNPDVLAPQWVKLAVVDAERAASRGEREVSCMVHNGLASEFNDDYKKFQCAYQPVLDRVRTLLEQEEVKNVTLLCARQPAKVIEGSNSNDRREYAETYSVTISFEW